MKALISGAGGAALLALCALTAQRQYDRVQQTRALAGLAIDDSVLRHRLPAEERAAFERDGFMRGAHTQRQAC